MQTKLLKAAVSGVVVAGVLFTASTASAASYTVKSGDTLSKIAADYNTTVENLVVLNKITNKHFIEVGQVIELDGYVSQDALAHVHNGVLDTAYAETITETVTYTTEATPVATTTYTAPAATTTAPATQTATTTNYTGSNIVLSNGNTAGSTGVYAAAQIAAATGTSASQWEYIIAKESNGNVSAYNPSGASGLFQTMPFWGSTATVEDQIQAAIRAYNAQGFSAWGF